MRDQLLESCYKHNERPEMGEESGITWGGLVGRVIQAVLGIICWGLIINIMRDPRWGRNQVLHGGFSRKVNTGSMRDHLLEAGYKPNEGPEMGEESGITWGVSRKVNIGRGAATRGITYASFNSMVDSATVSAV